MEVKKIAYRQTKDGVVISFLVHPNEVVDTVAVAPLGTRYVAALVEIGDNEEPVSHEGPAPAVPHGPSTALERTTPIAVPGRDTAKSERAKANFRALPEMKQDVVRAAMLIKDETFQGWILGADFDRLSVKYREVETDRDLKFRLGITSKSEIGESRDINERWRNLHTSYLADTNQLAEVR
jgi:hypothetical protein